MNRKRLYIKLLSYAILTLLIYFISDYYIKKDEDVKLHQRYESISLHMKKNLLTLISDKKNATLAIALSMVKDEKVKEALVTKNSSLIDFKKFSLELREKTKFKNVWFQLINKDGKSFYRSWTKNKNDSLLFRPDVRNLLKTKKEQTTISVGHYDMSFKSMVPVFKGNDFIGIFEVITHFNSISKELEKDNIDSIFIANKIFKSQLVYSFSNKFIDDYYIVNINAKKYFLELIQTLKIEKLLPIKNYITTNESLLTIQKIELGNQIIGYGIMVKNLENIDIRNIISAKKSFKSYVIFFIIFLGILFLITSYYIHLLDIKKLNSELAENLEKIKVQEKKNQTILDSQKNIIVITDGENLQNVNKQFLEFFNEYSSLKEYKKDYSCICENFVEMEDESYLVNKGYNNKNWAEFILANPNKVFKAAIKRENFLHHFVLNVNLTNFDNKQRPFIVVTLTEITLDMEQKKRLKILNDNLELLVAEKTKELTDLNNILEERIKEEIEKSKNKDRVMFQQNKMAALGEMLSNIAHQWRQPLSVISTIASSIKVKREMNILDIDEIELLCEDIIENTKYLSQTIEDFSNFFRQEKTKTHFNLKNSIVENLNLLKEKLKSEQIEIDVDIDEIIDIYGFKNEFQQAIINIINNSIDAFCLNESKTKRVIIFSFKDNTLFIKDSAGGVEEKILDKLFEPYFTTKHQSQGTGIGLYMTQQILSKHMDCNLNVSNKTFKYKNKDYLGLQFDILFENPSPKIF